MSGFSSAALLVLAGCTISPLARVEAGSASDAPSATSDGGNCAATISYRNDVQPWFGLRCASCHDWTPQTLVTAAPSMEKCGPAGAGANFQSSWRLVAPGDLANSVLWWYAQDCCAPACGVSCGGACLSPPCSSAIPKCGRDDPLCQTAHRTTDAERDRLRCWILEGAPNN